MLGLLCGLTAFWLGLSGHYTPLLLTLGALSILVSALLAARLDILDREGSPYHLLPRIALYMPWLVGEIIKANISVIRACLRADLDINPTLVKVKTTCESDTAKALFANSITLTPGTVTIQVERDRLLVHALYEELADPASFDDMDRRSRRAVDGREAAE
ncbi:MAG: Na+/H+ antiporter subunit E [Pseudomonadota bacterium]